MTTAVAKLDKRRTKWLTRAQAATEADGALAAVDKELDAVARQRETDKAALEAAETRVAELKRGLKASAKQRERLRADRTRARRDVKTARRRSEVAEKRFDRALLADVVQKAKLADLSANSGASRPATTARRNGAAPRRTPAGARKQATPAAASAGTNGRSARS